MQQNFVWLCRPWWRKVWLQWGHCPSRGWVYFWRLWLAIPAPLSATKSHSEWSHDSVVLEVIWRSSRRLFCSSLLRFSSYSASLLQSSILDLTTLRQPLRFCAATLRLHLPDHIVAGPFAQGHSSVISDHPLPGCHHKVQTTKAALATGDHPCAQCDQGAVVVVTLLMTLDVVGPSYG